MHTLGLTWIMEDISVSLLPWRTDVRDVRIGSGSVRNTVIILSLSVLRDLELSRLTFWVVEDYFRLLANLPPTLKKLSVHGIRFRFDNLGAGCYATVRRAVELEHLEAHLGEDLSLLFRDDCPISLESLRVVYVPQARPHDLEDLKIVACRSYNAGTRAYVVTVSLPLTRLKALSITDGTELSDTLIELLSTPSNVPSPLEVLNFTIPLAWLMGGFNNLATALSQPCLRNLKELNLEMMISIHCLNRSRIFEERVEGLDGGVKSWE
ncbi:hypothetical protein ARMSODRAFT_1023195 [Armillaria solidipes]|uniref:F-box domain-containing protein n=1 Tax=Armillaria solidipes TaxID=1076256 RepID=A0A2H3B051_9AGAR|nr:hypothetical protein ARMSODRAFT_1023195 [Armillaria solidipes]